MSIAVVRKPSRHDGLPFVTAAEDFRDSANETTHSLLLVQLHRKSLLFPDIYYDRYGHHFTLMHDTGKGYNVGDPQVFLRPQLHNAYTSGKGPSPKAKLPLAFLDRPAGHPLVDSCTREYSGLDKRLSGSRRKQKYSRRAFCLVIHQLPTIHSQSGVTFCTPGFHFGVASCVGLAPPIWGASLAPGP